MAPSHRLLRIRAETTKNRQERVVPYSEATGELYAAYLRRLKSQDGPGLILSGSSTLTATLLEHGLADEVLLAVYPVLLATGKRFFAERTPPRSFGLVSTKAFPSGIIVTEVLSTQIIDALVTAGAGGFAARAD